MASDFAMTRAQAATIRHGDKPQLSDFETERRSSPYLCFAWMIPVLLLFGYVRFRLRNMPLERDEGEYAYAAQLLLRGLPPYTHLYSVKLPGTYAAYAAILRIFGESTAGIHIGLLLVNAVTVLLLFLVGRRLFDRMAALVAAATYALLSAGANVNGLAGHATHFVVLFAVAGIWVLLRALEGRRSVLYFSAGLLFSLASLMKQPGAVFIAWAAIYLVRRLRSAGISRRRVSGELIVFSLGASLPFAITCLLMQVTGEFHNFWFWTFSYLHNYGSAVPLNNGLRLFYLNGSQIVRSAPGIWLIALFGLSAFAWNAPARQNSFFTISLLLFSSAGASAGLYFRPHYFILVLPAVSILTGVAIEAANEQLSNKWAFLGILPAFVFVLAFACSLYLQRQVLFRIGPSEAVKEIYPHNPFAEAVSVAKYIQANTRKGDTVAILGSEPEIFFYSHRLSATGYIYMYPLLEPSYVAISMQTEMITEIEKSRPTMLVLVNVPASWIAYANIGSMDGVLSWARKYIAANYVQDGVVEIGPETSYVWGEQARADEPATRLSILVFRRK